MNDNAKHIIKILNDFSKSSEARFVGGCVRDFIHKKAEIDFYKTDIDIATNLTPDKVTEALEANKIRVIPTGIEFGTVTAVYQQKNYEITTLRSDISTDGRHAKVSFTTDWLEDAKRRDFTFNALYMDIGEQITDFFDGKADLQNGVVRFIGNPQERITEDFLRILRLFRFHAYFGKGDILPNQLENCKNLKHGLDKISGERIRTEMLKLLLSPNCHNAINAMVASEILPQITQLEINNFKIDNISKAIEINEGQNNPITILISILGDEVSEAQIENIMERWKFSNKEKSFIYRLQEALQINHEDDYQVRKSVRINGKEEFFEYVILNYAKGIISKSKALQLISFAQNFATPDFPVKSADLFEMGIKQGNLFGKYLRKAEEIWERSNYSLDKMQIIEKVKLSEL